MWNVGLNDEAWQEVAADRAAAQMTRQNKQLL